MKNESYLVEEFSQINIKNISIINMYINNITLGVIDYFRNKRKSQILNHLINSKLKLKELIYELDMDNEEVMKALTYGKISMLYNLIESENKYSLNCNNIEKNHFNNQYLMRILKVIEKNGYASNLELIDDLRITKSNLSNIVSRLEKLEYFHVKKLSNKKYYFITYDGRKFLEYFKDKEPRFARILYESRNISRRDLVYYNNEVEIDQIKVFTINYQTDKSYKSIGEI